LRGALRYAVEHSGASLEASARWLGKDAATLRRWLRGERRIDVEAVMRSRHLWPLFLRCLVIAERKARNV
jgi:hypothetical protein